MKVFKNVPLNGYDGKPIQLPIRDSQDSPMEMKDAMLVNILWLIWNSAPCETQVDSKNGRLLCEALDAAKGKRTIEMEEGVHEWLKPVAERVTPKVFRVNGNIVYEHIKEGFEKLRHPKDE